MTTPRASWRDQARAVDLPLVQELLARLEPYSCREAQRLVPGVTDNDVSRWRRGEWRTLTAAKRRAIKAYLQR